MGHTLPSPWQPKAQVVHNSPHPTWTPKVASQGTQLNTAVLVVVLTVLGIEEIQHW